MQSLEKRLGITKEEFKAFLIKEYQTKSQQQIATDLKCHVEALRVKFKKLGISARDESARGAKRWHKEIQLDSKQEQIITGLLLSDLHLSKPHIQARASFGFKYKDFAQSIIDELKPLDFHDLYQNRNTNCFHSKSKSCEYLAALHSKWYKDGIKIVPRDLELSPQAVYWWYLGDGRVEDYALGLCTDGFLKEDVEFLKTKLEELGFKCSYYNSSNRVRICSDSVLDFIKYIGGCMHPCYSYKWNIRMKRGNGKWEKQH